jgi:tetratricopeptide (TPR) repeat protein
MDIGQQHFERGEALSQMNRHKEALEEYFKCLSYTPDNSAAFWRIAIAYLKLNDFKNTILFVEKYIAQNPQSADGFYLNAVALASDRRDSEVEKYIKESIALDPNQARYWAFFAQWCTKEGRFEEGLSYAAKGLKLEPESILCLNRKVDLLSQLGRVEEAKAVAKIVLSIDPNNPHVHNIVGRSHLKSENIEAAETHFREALRIRPTLKAAEIGLEEAKEVEEALLQKKRRYRAWGIVLLLMFTIGILMYGLAYLALK